MAVSKSRERDLKKAIRGYASANNLTRKTYYKIRNHELVIYMKENGIGTRWISQTRINRIRSTLPKQYRTK